MDAAQYLRYLQSTPLLASLSPANTRPFVLDASRHWHLVHGFAADPDELTESAHSRIFQYL